MSRILTIFSLAAVLLATLSMPFMVLHPGEVVLGGEYHLSAEESLQGDISFYFAQVTIDDGASIEGRVFLYSSTMDLSGNVTKDIHAFESDLTLRETARVEGKINQNDFIHWTLLLPAIAQTP